MENSLGSLNDYCSPQVVRLNQANFGCNRPAELVAGRGSAVTVRPGQLVRLRLLSSRPTSCAARAGLPGRSRSPRPATSPNTGRRESPSSFLRLENQYRTVPAAATDALRLAPHRSLLRLSPP